MDSVLLGQAVFKKVLAKVGGPFAAARHLQISHRIFHRVLHAEAWCLATCSTAWWESYLRKAPSIPRSTCRT